MNLKFTLMIFVLLGIFGSIGAQAETIRNCHTSNGRYRIVIQENSETQELQAEIYEHQVTEPVATYQIKFHQGLPVGHRTEYRDVETNGDKFDLAFQDLAESTILLNAIVRDGKNKSMRIQDDDVHCPL